MNLDDFAQQLVALSSRTNILLQRTEGLGLSQKELGQESFEELYLALEETEVALEELRQQQEELTATQALVEAERQRYQALFEEVPDGYLVTDESGTIQEANRAAASLFNIEQRFLIGKPLNAFFTQEARQDFPQKLNQLQQVKRVQDWEVRLRPRQGDIIDVALRAAVVQRTKDGPITLRWLLRDITAIKQMEASRAELENEIIIQNQVKERLLHNTFHDVLTNLPNRALFINRLERAIRYSKRHRDYLFAVLFLDLDRFKVINDSLGHTFGDQLLIAVAKRLASVVRPTDVVARMGGDEFTILLEGIEGVADAAKVANRVQESLRLPLLLGIQEVFTTASIGIALSTTSYNQPSDILRDADIAMYRAKSQGQARYEVFNEVMHAQAVARLQMENDLHRAIEHEEFRVYYQPIVSLKTGLLTGFEALVRWERPNYGLLPPADFIGVAEEARLSLFIDQWVIEAACRQAQQWRELYPYNSPLTISVNICNQHFAQANLSEQIERVLRETNLPAHCLQMEITENVIMENNESATATLEQLRALGVQLSIDDFGTGYSSLSRLHYLSINGLKIDRSFIIHMSTNQGNLEIVETIMTLAQKLGVKVTAEGLETKEQLAQLRAMKCEYGQGYFFSQPLDSSTAEALIVKSVQWSFDTQLNNQLSGSA